MRNLNSEINQLIINKLINSDINVTPSVLDFIVELDDPLEKINLIIRELSFIPTFNGHITKEVLKKISNKEIQKALKRVQLKDDTLKIDENSNQELKIIKKVKESICNKENVENESEILKIKKKPQETKVFASSEIKNSIKSEQKKSNFSIKKNKNPSYRAKEKVKIKPYESTKSFFKFKPIAKEYEYNYEIVKDPTGKLHTTGDYKDFYELTLDKFNQLQKLMKKRGDTFSATNINNILRNTRNQNVSIIGLVNEIRQTKNGNYLINLEDLTGSLNILVTRNSEKNDIFKIAERTIEDQMIFVEGTYNPGEKGKSGIIFVNNLKKIDIPVDYEPNKSPDPLSLILLSDTHIGSKEFEEKLWNRFIKFLNGKIGNKSLREIAGRVKYIIINGDLVDGIGVYPNQENDLIISDIYQQFKKASELLSGVPEHIKIFFSSGNHEPVRNAIPRPAVPKKYAEELINKMDIECLGNPTMIKTHNVNTLSFHGDSIMDLNLLIQGLENDTPAETMKEMLICRHLAPVYGKKTQIAPTSKDWLVIDKIPDIFHTGHIHINDMNRYRNVFLVNSGCFQSQTEFMQSFGIHPTPGIVSIIELDTLKGLEIDLKKFY